MAKNIQIIERFFSLFAPVGRLWARFMSDVVPVIAKNWPVKILCLAFALILFVFHRMSNLEERVFSIPLTVEVDPAMIPASVYTKVIHITLRGDPKSISSILAEDIEAYIDLEGKSKGVYRLPVQVRKKGAALNVEPLEISVEPLELSLALDYKLSKRVPISANIDGILQQGYELVSYELDPKEAVIEGPFNTISGIDSISTDIIALDRRSNDFSAMVNIAKQDPLVELRGNGIVEFHAYIGEIIQIENFDSMPINIIGLDPRFEVELEPETGSVSLEGSQLLLKDYRPPASLLSVDCSSITERGAYTFSVVVNQSDGFRVVRQEPENIRVYIENRGGITP
jgi:hypothetical protein